MRVAIVHDYLTQYGGAERVIGVLSEMFPEAPIFTLFYDREKTRGAFEGKKMIESFWSHIPLIGNIVRRHNQMFFWLMPWAIEHFSLKGFDLVVSSSATYAKGIKVPDGTIHVCYCHTPTRYLWDDLSRYVTGFYANPLVRFVGGFFLSAVRRWDSKAASRPHFLVANSSHTAENIRRYYGRKPDAVIFPPVDIARFRRTNVVSTKQRNYFLMIGRLLHYKRFDLGIEAARRLGFDLWIVGEGREFKALKHKAPPNVRFLGWVSDADLPAVYAGAQALIMPQVEDFGMVAVEALASSTPVIAYRGGGATDIVRDGSNGVFFDVQTVEGLCEAIERFSRMTFDREHIAVTAERFSKERFEREFSAFIEKVTARPL